MKKKSVLIFSIIFLVIILFSLPVYAEEQQLVVCNLCGEEHDLTALEEKSNLCYISYGMYCGLYGDLFDSSGGLGGLSMTSLLTFKDSEGEVFKQLTELAGNIYSQISIVGEILIFLYFFLELVEENIQRDGFTYETFTRFCIRTILAFILINNGMKLITFLIDLSAAFFGDIAYIDPSSLGYAFTIENCPYTLYMENQNIINTMGHIVQNVIPYAAMCVARVLLTAILYARLIEITVRIMFAPIGMFDIFHKGLRSNGWLYVKRLFASLLQGACIAAVFLAYSYVNIYIKGSVGGFLGTIVLSFTLIGLTLKSQEIVRDVIGV